MEEGGWSLAGLGRGGFENRRILGSARLAGKAGGGRLGKRATAGERRKAVQKSHCQDNSDVDFGWGSAHGMAWTQRSAMVEIRQLQQEFTAQLRCYITANITQQPDKCRY